MSEPDRKEPQIFIQSRDPRLRATGIFAFPSMMTTETAPITGATKIELHHQIFTGNASFEDIERFKFEINMRALAMLKGEPEGNLNPDTPPAQGQSRP